MCFLLSIERSQRYASMYARPQYTMHGGVELNFKFFARKHRVSRNENTVLLHKPAAVSLQLNELCTRWGITGRGRGKAAANEFIIVFIVDLNRLLNSLPLLFCASILTFRLNTTPATLEINT